MKIIFWCCAIFLFCCSAWLQPISDTLLNTNWQNIVKESSGWTHEQIDEISHEEAFNDIQEKLLEKLARELIDIKVSLKQIQTIDFFKSSINRDIFIVYVFYHVLDTLNQNYDDWQKEYIFVENFQHIMQDQLMNKAESLFMQVCQEIVKIDMPAPIVSVTKRHIPHESFGSGELCNYMSKFFQHQLDIHLGFKSLPWMNTFDLLLNSCSSILPNTSAKIWQTSRRFELLSEPENIVFWTMLNEISQQLIPNEQRMLHHKRIFVLLILSCITSTDKLLNRYVLKFQNEIINWFTSPGYFFNRKRFIKIVVRQNTHAKDPYYKTLTAIALAKELARKNSLVKRAILEKP